MERVKKTLTRPQVLSAFNPWKIFETTQGLSPLQKGEGQGRSAAAVRLRRIPGGINDPKHRTHDQFTVHFYLRLR